MEIMLGLRIVCRFGRTNHGISAIVNEDNLLAFVTSQAKFVIMHIPINSVRIDWYITYIL